MNAVVQQIHNIAFDANNKIEDLTVEVGAQKGHIQQLQEQLAHEQAQFCFANNDLEELRQKLEEEKTVAEAHEKQKKEAIQEKDEYATKNAELAAKNAELAKQNAELAKAVSMWKRRATAKHGEIKTLQNKIQILQQQKGNLLHFKILLHFF